MTAKLNPFTDQPAPPELFVGRQSQLESIRRSLEDSLLGQPRHVLIIGEKGMGKSSIASYAEHLAIEVRTDGKRVFPVLVSLGGCRDVDDVCIRIIFMINAKVQTNPQQIIDKFRNFFGSLSSLGISVGTGGIGLNIARDSREISRDLRLRFAEILVKMAGCLPDEYGTLLVILDELDYISSVPEFSPFVKSLVETLSLSKERTVSLIMTTSPVQKQELEKSHETIFRGFKPLEIDSFSPEETRMLVERALKRGIPLKSADEDFFNSIQHYCSGIPYFIHEVGYSAFEYNNDDTLSRDDFVAGVLGTSQVVGAIKNLEIKLFRKWYQEDVLSNSYRRMLLEIASFDEDTVKVKDLKDKLSLDDRKRLAVYLSNMVKRGVLKKTAGVQGQYSLPDRLFKVFLRLQLVKPERSRNQNEGAKHA